ncbi:hypothetical protein [Halorussus salinus]|uniref:hypothetical protein n=1 Tax=Halorussus salinus TaxID=1364935 RepID=UPI0010931E30|nr:hypothetical protein [Halorussus salinus]
MLLELLFGFLVLVAASYVGTTMALRGFFGRERYDGRFESGGDGPPDNGSTPDDGGPPETDGRGRTTDGRDARTTDSRDPRKRDDENRTDDVPRASDVSGRGE